MARYSILHFYFYRQDVPTGHGKGLKNNSFDAVEANECDNYKSVSYSSQANMIWFIKQQ